MSITGGGTGRWAGAALLALLVGIGGCGGDGGGAEAPLAEGQEVVYVDVRTPEEYAAGHVEGAINIPHTEMGERWTELEEHRDDRLVLYCRSGRRSGIALRVLEQHGFDDLVNAGGLSDLAGSGVPTTR